MTAGAPTNLSEEICHKLESSPDRNFALIAIGTFTLEMAGLFGNAISVLVLIGRFLKRDIFRFFLSALCLADMGTLICAMFMLTVPEIAYKTNPGQDVILAVNRLVVLIFPIGHMLKTCSTWLVAVMSVYRFVYVKNTLLFRKIGKRDIARAVIACICIFSFLVNLPRMFELKIQDCTDGKGRLYSEVGMTALRASREYQISYHATAATCFRFVLPISTILFCNCYLLTVLCRGRKYTGRKADEHTHQNATSFLLVTVGFVFLVCNSFSFVVTVIEITMVSGVRLDPGFLRYEYAIFTDVSNFLTVANASINFLVFLAFNHRFRSVVVGTIFSFRSGEHTSALRTRRESAYSLRVKFA